LCKIRVAENDNLLPAVFGLILNDVERLTMHDMPHRVENPKRIRVVGWALAHW
jgi:hypothetical protein